MMVSKNILKVALLGPIQLTLRFILRNTSVMNFLKKLKLHSRQKKNSSFSRKSETL